jgi:hypothetical protein|tara:strand:+ start:342 stop:701 length:360 start_codon:yes stop_codon:yes gene_type:complete
MAKKAQKGRGRPVKSVIRDRMQQIVDALGSAYGYEVYKIYKQVFEPVDIRSMYYHFKRGVDLGEFKQIGAKQEKGGFTWGRESTHIYYSLGQAASHKANSDLQNKVKELGFENRGMLEK